MSTEISNSHGCFVRLYGIVRGIFYINKGVTPYVTELADEVLFILKSHFVVLVRRIAKHVEVLESNS